MSDLFWFSDRQFARMRVHFRLAHGAPCVDDRPVISGIIHVIKNGLRWCDAPAYFGPHKTLYDRFVRWRGLGIFDRVFSVFASEEEPETQMIDATRLKAHWTASSLAIKGMYPTILGEQRAA